MKRLKRLGFAVGILLVLATAAPGWCSLFSRDMLGLEAGTVHPFLSFSGEYTDNLFATNDNTESDWISYITPGVWLSLPGADAEVINIASSSSVPGGMAQTRFQTDAIGRYQGFLKYAPTFENYLDFSERDFTSHQLDAYAAANFAGGISLELIDQYKDYRDAVEEETDSAEYNNNLLTLTASYFFTDKMKARVDVGYYDVNYNSQAPEKDRVDTSVSGYLFFDVLPKTTAFGEISHVDIEYDSVDRDSKEMKFFVGAKYNATDRIDAMGKIGMMRKELDAVDDSQNDLALEGLLSYELSDRAKLTASLSRANNETTTGSSYFVTETNSRLIGSYMVTERISASLMVSLIDEDYDNIDRTDTTMLASPRLAYAFNNYIFASFSYSYSDRDVDGKDVTDASAYTENSVMLSVTASL